MNIGSLPSIGPNQIQTIGLDFGNWLPSGVVFDGTPTVNLSSRFGFDLNPQARVIVGPTLGTVSVAQGGTGIANAAIIFQVANCVPGTAYVIDAFCDLSNTDRVEASANFNCVLPG